MALRHLKEFIIMNVKKHIIGIIGGTFLGFILFALFGCPEWSTKETKPKPNQNPHIVVNCNNLNPVFTGGSKSLETRAINPESEDICNFIYNATDNQIEIEGELIGVNNRSVYEGDIIVTIDDAGKIQNFTDLWPNAIVPYKLATGCFNESYTNTVILQAIKELENGTCIRFRPVESEHVYLSIDCSYGCSSQIGYWHNNSTAAQNHHRYMSIDPKKCWYGNVLHEFLHAIGLHHMHNAYNRDSYVRICYENVEEFKKEELFFRKANANDSSYNVFDFKSIMMLPLNVFSRNTSSYTIYPLVANLSETEHVGQRKSLTSNDISAINKLYKC